jgi:Domain of unknown function (DUF4340)
MKLKLLIGLAVVALAAVGGAVAVSTSQKTTTPQAQSGQRLYPELAARADDIQSIVIARKDGSFRIVRDGDRWLVPDKSKYPASTDAVRRLLVGLSELRALEAKTTTAATYPELDVENVDSPNAKSVQVSLLDAGGGTVLSVIVGKSRFGRGGGAGDGVYVRKAGDAQAWLAQGRVTVDREIVAWLDRKIAEVPRERVSTVTVKAPGQTLTVSRAKADDKDFALKDVPADRKAKAAYDINAVGGAFEGLELDDVRPAADVKFTATSPATEAVTFDGLRITASFAEQDGATWVRFAAKAEPPATPVKTEGESKLKSADEVKKEGEAINARVGGWAYKLQTYKAEALRRKLEDLLEQKAS